MNNIDIFKDIKEYYRDKTLINSGKFEYLNERLVHILGSSEKWYIDFSNDYYYCIGKEKEFIGKCFSSEQIYPDEIKNYG